MDLSSTSEPMREPRAWASGQAGEVNRTRRALHDEAGQHDAITQGRDQIPAPGYRVLANPRRARL